MPRHNEIADRQGRSTLMATQMVKPVSRLIRMEDRLLAALVACLTNLMRGFAVCHLWLKRVDEDPRREFLQPIPILLCGPRLDLSHMFFKAAYFCGHVRLARLGRQSALLGRQDLSLQFDNRFPKFSPYLGYLPSPSQRRPPHGGAT